MSVSLLQDILSCLVMTLFLRAVRSNPVSPYRLWRLSLWLVHLPFKKPFG